MKTFRRSFAILGMTIGLLPTALFVVADRSRGFHGSQLVSAVFLVVLGLPGMLVGATIGELLQHGVRSARYVVVPVGGVLGGIAGISIPVFADPQGIRFWWLLRFQDSCVLGVFVGGVCGVLVAGLVPRTSD